MPRRKASPDDASARPSFEEALAGLEAIVEAMEHDQLPLEELVAHYEKGSALLDRCEDILQSARSRIELITLRNKSDTEPGNESGTAVSTDFSLPAGMPDDSDEEDDIRLF